MAAVRESAALAVARLSLLNIYKVTDVVGALCRCLLADGEQVWSLVCMQGVAQRTSIELAKPEY